MLKSIIKTAGCLACLVWSATVSATGLGGINVSSNLGQPLKASIELVSVDKADKSSITAKLASADAFKNAGIEYPYSLPKLKFEVTNQDNGESFIKVTSAQAINEPFVTLLVEVSWSSGKLMREYTFLLDPADYKVQEPRVEAVKQAAPVVVSPVVPNATPDDIPLYSEPVEEGEKVVVQTDDIPLYEPSANTAEEIPLYASSDASTEEIPLYASSDAATEEVPLYVTTGEEPLYDSTDSASQATLSKVETPQNSNIVVKKGDTLTRIANQTKPAEVSLERMLVALYRANADAFEGKNMNRLKRGRIIRLPDATELESVKQREAVKEFHAQVADWNVYRQQLASSRITSTDRDDKQESSGKVTTAVDESTAKGKEPAKEVLKLSKGEAPGDKSVGAGKTSAQDKKNAIEEEEIAKNLAIKEAQDRAALLEKNVRDLQRLADLKKQIAAGQVDEKTEQHNTASSGGSAVAAASAPVVAVTKTPDEQKVVTQPSLVDQLISDPLMLAGGAALLLGLGGVGFMIARRGKVGGSGQQAKMDKESKKKKYESEDAASSTGRITAPIAPSPETGDFTKTAVVDSPSAQSGSEEVDPIGEADLFLTFGRDAQAEEVLKEALNTNPGNSAVRLKLLSIYASHKDTNAFFTHARVLKESGDQSAWTQASAMGRELEPGNPLYGGGNNDSSTSSSNDSKGAKPAVDFDLGFGATIVRPVHQPEYQTTVMMEAPTQHESTDILTSDELRAAQSQAMDFDVSGAQPVMDFDVSEAQPGEKLNSSSGTTSSPNFDDMVFDVTSSHADNTGNSKAKSPAKSASESVDDLIFDVTSNKPDSNATRNSANKTGAPTDDSLAFTLDFPGEISAVPAKKAAAPTDFSLGDINLNLDELAPGGSSTGGSVKGENWQEVTTKLDLAKAYQEMGDAAGAKEILDEVLRDGDEKQRATAQAMLQQL